jgi:tetratricopeptide (TPR) repeat protein
VAAISAAAGALGMWGWMQSRPPPSRGTNAAPAGVAPGNHEPAPELTAGLAPAAAARVRGNFYYDHGNWPKAAAEYQIAIQQGGDDADIRTDLANALQFSGHGTEAVVQYQAAQRMNPAHEASLFNLGVCYAEALGDAAKAVETWQDFLRRFPASAKAADAQRMIAMAQAMAAGTMPSGHPPVGDSATAPVAGATPPPADADVERMMRFVKPAAPPATPPAK